MEPLGIAKRILLGGMTWRRRGWALLKVTAAALWFASVNIAPTFTGQSTYAQADTVAPHLDPVHGVQRIVSPLVPIGSCDQCHYQHEQETGDTPLSKLLFSENTNNLCYTVGGAGPCHQAMPANYPADETHRIPDGFPDAGYFEYNSGGAKIYGVQYRSRWPGAVIYDDATLIGLNYVSPHRNDPDMPRIDANGAGSCLNCHDAHGTPNPFDALVGAYRGIGGFDEPTYPQNRYGLCFDCHSAFGPAGMNPTGRLIADFYDSSINGNTAGHQINKDPDIAISWPSYVNVGDKLPCYECHNPHGSRGYSNEGANAFLISDSRPGWSNLTDTRNDPIQTRRFCFSCHIPADGVPGSREVSGIVMNTIPTRAAHELASIRSCYECHGADYGQSRDNNVHNPKS